MRDKRKDVQYFESYISTAYDRLSKFEEKRKTLDNTEKVDLYISTISMNILIGEFSAGANKDTLYSAYKRVIAFCKKPSYEDILRILSFAVLFEDKSDILNFVESNDAVIRKDKLLGIIANYIVTDKYPLSKEYIVESLYSQLNVFFNAKTKDEKEIALIEYMENWYENSKEASWYNSLNSINNVYYGYWCFEAAALASIYNLQIDILARNQYFPQM